MAREARKLSKSGNYYVELKGDRLFGSDDDKKQFIEILEKNFATGIIHGYRLNNDKIRLVVKESEKGISMAMKSVTTSYARYFNRIHVRDGKLFTDRFKSEPLETEEEITEYVKSLDKKAAVKRKRTKKTKPEEKIQIKKEDNTDNDTAKNNINKSVPKKSLPSWLL